MALITCPNCGKQVSDKAAKCPHCGLVLTTQPTQTEVKTPESETTTTSIEKRRKKWPIFVVVGACLVVLFAALWFFVLNDSKGNKKDVVENTETNNTTDPNGPDDRYLTQDLRMWGLLGPVRDLKTTVSRIDGPKRWDYADENELYMIYFSQNIQFDKQGHFSSIIDGNFAVKEIAKKDGDRILEAKDYIEDFDFCISREWDYYPNGLVKQSVLNGLENHETCQYYYNEVGELVKTETSSEAEGTKMKTVTTYSIKERDGYGNWTKQIAEVTEYEYDYNNNDYKIIAVRHEMYNRTIHYHGQESSSQYVVINGSELRLRLGPSTSADTFKWADGSNRHPNKGEKYLYLGESGDFYKIDFKGHEVWVSKQYTYLE